MNLKLQINDAGGWRQVMNFAPAHADQVRFHAAPLIALGNGDIKLRIVDENGNVSAYCLPGQGWVPPARAMQ